MGIGLGLELGSGVRVGVMARALYGIMVRNCSSIVQFLAILRIPRCTDVELAVWH